MKALLRQSYEDREQFSNDWANLLIDNKDLVSAVTSVRKIHVIIK